MSLTIILIYIVLLLVGLGLLAMLLFGARSLSYGKVSPTSMLMVSFPVALLIILGFVLDDWTKAAIFSVGIMIAVALLALLVTGVKGLFT